MKRIKYVWATFICCLVMGSCTDLKEEQFSQLRLDEFPNENAEITFQLVALDPVSHFRQFVSNQQWWLMLEGGTDECVVPARGGGWVDGNKWRDLHKHEWTKTHPTFNSMWNWAYQGVAKSNSALFTLKPVPDSPVKDKYVGQIKAIRALYYFLLMDSFGNVPLVTDFEDTSVPKQATRAEIYNFIETDLLDVVNDLDTKVNSETYGVPTKWFAHFLLAKLYINSKVYANKDDSAKALVQCETIIKDGPYALSTDYLSMFLPTNGPSVKESIFAMVNDAQFGSNLNFQVRFLPGNAGKKFGVNAGGWGGHATLPEFYNMFTDPTDQRNNQWLSGLIFDTDGKPVNNGNGQMNIINELRWGSFDPTNNFNVGGDTSTLPAGTVQGVRSVKYRPDPNHGGGQNMNNDFQVFRYADILLMKAELLLNTNNATALGLVNQVRTARSATLRTKLTSDDLLKERGFEFAFEGWRRNDLIRFGKWEGSWGIKTSTDPTRRLFPIPQNQIDTNPNLKQNSGY